MTNRGAYRTAHDKLMRCPTCHGAHVIVLKRNLVVRCRDCGAGCTRQEAEQAAEYVNSSFRKKPGRGSGQIAGPTYARGLANWGGRRRV